jgi:hypothetical protein
MPNVTKAELSKLQKRNEKIVALYKKGGTGAEIAKQFDLTAAMIYIILKKAGASMRAPMKKLPAKKTPAAAKTTKKTPAPVKAATRAPAKKIPAPAKAAGKAPAGKPSARGVAVPKMPVKKTRGRTKAK